MSKVFDEIYHFVLGRGESLFGKVALRDVLILINWLPEKPRIKNI